MARPEVPDTTVFIQLVRDPDRYGRFLQSLSLGRIWLSSVVVAELYAGTRSQREAVELDRMVAAMDRVQRVLTPTTADWARAGRLIARRIRLYGSLKPRDHLSDVLIVVSAARLGAVVLSANIRHLQPWVDLACSSGLDVAVAAG